MLITSTCPWPKYEFCYRNKISAGELTLSPMTVAPVCRVGDPLQLTCTATAFIQFLQWSITVVDDQGRLEEITAFSNSRDTTQALTQITVNSTTFTFIRSSAQGATPLISTLSIDLVSIGLNGTVVRCVDAAMNSSTLASTTIQIIDASKSGLN